MITSFKHKGLAKLFELGSSRRVKQDLQARTLRRLDALHQAESLTDLNVPGFNFHGLYGLPNDTAFMSTARGASPLNGKKARRSLCNIIEVKS